MTIEQKAKAYDEALNKIKRLLGTGSNCSREELEYVFPELRESEDERIRKYLIDVVNDYCKGSEHDGCIAWLENQGKKTEPIEGFNTEFERQVSCLIASAMNKDYEYTKDFVKWTSDALLNYAKLEIEKNSMGISEVTKKKLEDNLNKALEKETPESWNKFLDKQGEQKPVDVRTTGYWHVEDTEQKPAWSEEDERCLTNAIDACKQMSDEDYDYSQSYIDAINFLKSLKDRCTWKPSDEQIQALEYQVHSTFEGSWQYKASKELLEQLKKL